MNTSIYPFIFFIAILVIGVGLSWLVRRRGRDEKGTPGPAVTRDVPSADEPTPGASTTAKAAQADQANRKTPPA